MAKRKKTGHRGGGKKKQGQRPPKKPKYASMLVPGKPVPHVCGEAGRCCWGRLIGLSPFDVWRMMSSGALEPFGYHTTGELTDIETGAVRYALGSSSKLPVAYIRQVHFRGEEGAATHCPFLRPALDAPIDTDDLDRLMKGELPAKRNFWAPSGKPRFKCSLGRAKPSECVMFPVYRGGELDLKEDVRHWQFISDTSICRKCMVTPVRKEGSGEAVNGFLESMRVELQYTKDYISFNYLVAQFVPSDEVRMQIAKTIYDWHTLMLEQGCQRDRLRDEGPPTPGDVLGAGMFLIRSAAGAQRALAERAGATAAEPKEEGSLIIKP